MFKRETKTQHCAIYNKNNIFLSSYFIQILFLRKLFAPFQESNCKTCKQGSKRIKPKSPSKRPGETHQMATDDRTRHGSHPAEKSYPALLCEFVIGRSLRMNRLDGNKLDSG